MGPNLEQVELNRYTWCPRNQENFESQNELISNCQLSKLRTYVGSKMWWSGFSDLSKFWLYSSELTIFSSIKLNCVSDIGKPVTCNFQMEFFSHACCKFDKLSFVLYFNLIHYAALIQIFFSYEIYFTIDNLTWIKKYAFKIFLSNVFLKPNCDLIVLLH